VTAPSSRELICVDLCGMRAALVEQARARGVSPSEFLRTALADALKSGGCSVRAAPGSCPATKARMRLSLRMSSEDRGAILADARKAGLKPGAFVAGLASPWRTGFIMAAAGRPAAIAYLFLESLFVMSPSTRALVRRAALRFSKPSHRA